MAALESFTKKERKNVLSSLFGNENSSESEEDSDCENTSTSSPDPSSSKHHESVENIPDASIDHIQSFSSTFYPQFSVKFHERKVLGIAHQLWPAASLLTDFLLCHPQYLLGDSHSMKEMEGNREELNVIELGAGLGLTSIYLAAFFNQTRASLASKINANEASSATESTSSTDKPDGSPATVLTMTKEAQDLYAKLQTRCFIITDIAEAIDSIEENIVLNHDVLRTTVALEEENPVIVGKELYWGNHQHILDIMQAHFTHTSKPPLIIAADVVYWEHLFAPLCQALEVLCKEYHCHVIIAHVKRWKKDSKFFALLKKKGLTIDTIHEDIGMKEEENTGELRKHIQRIYRIFH